MPRVPHIPALLVLIALCAGSVLAAEGRVPIATSPFVISNPGKFIVTRNLPSNPAGPIITVLASDVDIDLNGKQLDQSTGSGPAISADDPGKLVVRHGTLLHGGIYARDTTGNGRVVVEDVRFDVAGIELDNVQTFRITDNIVVGGATAVKIDSPSAPRSGIIRGNVIAGPTTGIDVRGGGSLQIVDNVLADIGISANDVVGDIAGTGIVLRGSFACIVADNTLRGVANVGISLISSEGCRLQGNSVYETAGPGIWIAPNSGDNVLLENVVVGSQADHGVEIAGSRNEIRSNRLNGSAQFGLYLTTGADYNVFRGNSAHGNCSSGCVCGIVVGNEYCDINSPTTNINAGGNHMP